MLLDSHDIGGSKLKGNAALSPSTCLVCQMSDRDQQTLNQFPVRFFNSYRVVVANYRQSADLSIILREGSGHLSFLSSSLSFPISVTPAVRHTFEDLLFLANRRWSQLPVEGLGC